MRAGQPESPAGRGISVNKLMEEMSTQAIASFDAETRVRAMAAQGDAQKASAILDRLDQEDDNIPDS